MSIYPPRAAGERYAQTECIRVELSSRQRDWIAENYIMVHKFTIRRHTLFGMSVKR